LEKKMHGLSCEKCGMKVKHLHCGKCGAPLEHKTVELAGKKTGLCECPKGCGKIKSPQCCGQDMKDYSEKKEAQHHHHGSCCS
jgi:hypothetical protein